MLNQVFIAGVIATLTPLKKQAKPTKNEYYSLENMEAFFKGDLTDYGLGSRLAHIDCELFFSDWALYVSLPKENVKMYEEIKSAFIRLFGEKTYEVYRMQTRFLHQLWYLKKKGYDYYTDFAVFE